MKPVLILLTISFLPNICTAWDQSEMEIFDLIEEVNANFYDVLGIYQNSSQSEVRKAYRRLSLVLHPDKNESPDAEEKFRQLVGIYEVLKDETKRARYNKVLVEGLPNWRQPLYYYRRVRKMGMLELSVWLFVLITIGQYAVAWGSYFEKGLALDEKRAALQKKQLKQLKKRKIANDVGDEVDEVEQSFNNPKPSFKNTLPFQLVAALVGIPSTVRMLMEYRKKVRKEREERITREKEEAEELERLKEELEREKELKKTRKRRTIPLPNYDGQPDDTPSREDKESQQNEIKSAPKVVSGFWTDEDLAELASLMKKYPPGTTERWEKIAEALNRTVAEVTHFAKKVKENAFKPPEEVENETKEEKKKEKTRGGKNFLLPEPTQVENQEPPGSIGWTQKQQKSLETALATYTKGCSDRWDRIARAVPEKTKEECMLRVKYLSDLVRKKKQMEEEKSVEEAQDQRQDESEST